MGISDKLLLRSLLTIWLSCTCQKRIEIKITWMCMTATCKHYDLILWIWKKKPTPHWDIWIVNSIRIFWIQITGIHHWSWQETETVNALPSNHWSKFRVSCKVLLHLELKIHELKFIYTTRYILNSISRNPKFFYTGICKDMFKLCTQCQNAFSEILRVIDSLQLTMNKKVATPEGWQVCVPHIL